LAGEFIKTLGAARILHFAKSCTITYVHAAKIFMQTPRRSVSFPAGCGSSHTTRGKILASGAINYLNKQPVGKSVITHSLLSCLFWLNGLNKKQSREIYQEAK
jgi:hypothetical protein